MGDEELQVIDISDLSFDDVPRVEKLVADLSRICETSGFFYIKIEDKFGRHCLDMIDAARLRPQRLDMELFSNRRLRLDRPKQKAVVF